MGFYLRKSLRFGPIRLNLSRGGIGISAGVRGARVGLNSKGQQYTHAGVGGLYHRQTLGTTHRRAASASTGSDRVELREDTDATYEATVLSIERPSLRDQFSRAEFPKAWALGLAAVLALVAWVTLPAPGVPLSTLRVVIIGSAVLLALLMLYLAILGTITDRAARTLAQELSRVLAASKPALADLRIELADLLEQAYISPDQRTNLCASAYMDALAGVVRDGLVSDPELERLGALESVFELDSSFIGEARTAAYHEVYLRAVTDHILTEVEEAALIEIRGRLDIPEAEVSTELEMIERLSEVRQISTGDALPEIEPCIKLQRGEVCYFKGHGRMLADKILKRFQENGQKYAVRGLVIAKEGELFITSKRLLLVHSGTTSIRHAKIMDLDVDYDQSLLIIKKDGVQRPSYITTPDAIRAGAILAKAAGL